MAVATRRPLETGGADIEFAASTAIDGTDAVVADFGVTVCAQHRRPRQTAEVETFGNVPEFTGSVILRRSAQNRLCCFGTSTARSTSFPRGLTHAEK